jgi:hypothetical protein
MAAAAVVAEPEAPALPYAPQNLAAYARSGLLHEAAAPRGSITLAEVPLIGAEILFKDSEPAHTSFRRITRETTFLPKIGWLRSRTPSRTLRKGSSD